MITGHCAVIEEFRNAYPVVFRANSFRNGADALYISMQVFLRILKSGHDLQVLNGAMLYWPMDNTLYVEGYALDRFAEGAWGLQPVHQNRVYVGMLIDPYNPRYHFLQVRDVECRSVVPCIK